MRLFSRVAVLGLLVSVCAADWAHAAPILTGSTSVSTCDAVLNLDPSTHATPNCSVFGIDAVTSVLSGEFENDNDIALFRLDLTAGFFAFSAFTTSAGAGFDPVLALYGSDGQQLQYSTPNDGTFGVVNDDFQGQFDARIPEFIPQLLLNPDTYFLALTQTGNMPHGLLSDTLGGFDWAFDTSCGGSCPAFGGGSGSFAVELQLAPAVTPVPEPGTLSLLALGSACAGLARRRRMRRQAR